LEDPIAEEILKGVAKEGSTLIADHENNAEELTLSIKKTKAEKTSDAE
jgi:ATP-dependent Clp protease ATP-binding subunit ClpC